SRTSQTGIAVQFGTTVPSMGERFSFHLSRPERFVLSHLVSMSPWSPTSWHSLPVTQQPAYLNDVEAFSKVFDRTDSASRLRNRLSPVRQHQQQVVDVHHAIVI